MVALIIENVPFHYCNSAPPTGRRFSFFSPESHTAVAPSPSPGRSLGTARRYLPLFVESIIAFTTHITFCHPHERARLVPKAAVVLVFVRRTSLHGEISSCSMQNECVHRDGPLFVRWTYYCCCIHQTEQCKTFPYFYLQVHHYFHRHHPLSVRWTCCCVHQTEQCRINYLSLCSIAHKHALFFTTLALCNIYSLVKCG